MAHNYAPELQQTLMDIRFTTSALDDVETLLNAQRSRVRIMTTGEADSDGEIRGFGLSLDDPNVVMMRGTVEGLMEMEASLTKQLERQMKACPLGPWAKRQRGVGYKQAARLLAAIGDPYWRSEDIINTLDTSVTLRDGTVVESGGVKYPAGPRTLRQLWAYGGVHTNADGTAAVRRKGSQANWNAEAKKRQWLVLQSCIKQIKPTCKTDSGIGDHVENCECSPYRIVIDKRRQHTLTTHPDWSAGHSLSDAVRIGSRELLRDLYYEAKRIHTEAEQAHHAATQAA